MMHRRISRRALLQGGAVAAGMAMPIGRVMAQAKDELPRHEKFRPGTRGLEGTEPPA